MRTVPNWDQQIPENPDSPESMIYTFITERENGKHLLVLLNSTISPVGSTVQTLRVQLTWITVIMLILAFFLALFLSRRISGPIIKINSSAKVLAQGNLRCAICRKWVSGDCRAGRDAQLCSEGALQGGDPPARPDRQCLARSAHAVDNDYRLRRGHARSSRGKYAGECAGSSSMRRTA